MATVRIVDVRTHAANEVYSTDILMQSVSSQAWVQLMDMETTKISAMINVFIVNN